MKQVAVLFLLLCLSACQTYEGVALPEQSMALTDIRKIISGVCGGKFREISANEREIWSPYFAKAKDPSFDPQKSKDRLYAHFWILGDRRPYEIRVQVNLERKVDGQYELIGEDEKMTNKIAKELLDRLNKGPDPRNAIDDFRPF